MIDDLSLVTTKDMLAEIEKRFDCMIFCASVNRTMENNELEWLFRGGTPATLGLAEYAQRKVWELYLSDEAEWENLSEGNLS